MKGQLPLPVWGLSSEGVEQFGRSEALFSGHYHHLIMNWLRVFRSAEAARISPGVGQQRHTRAVRSEKCVRLRGRAWVRMRVIAMFFGPCAPDALPSHVSVLSHNFKMLERFTKLATSSL